jgi:uncharacterized membrane protein
VADSPRIKALGWYTLAGGIFAGGLAVAVFLVWRFVVFYEPPTRFVAPGAAEISVAKPGEYVVWHEHRTVYQGRSFDMAPALPHGTRYRVEGPGGLVSVEPYTGMKSESGEGRSVSTGRFEAPVRGTYRLTVEGAFEPRVIAVGPNRAWAILKLVAEVAILVLGTLGLAVAIVLYGFLRNIERPTAVFPGAPAQGSVRKLAELVYGLQAASLLVGVTLFAAVIVNYLRREQAAGTWLESHFTWQIRTFWWSLAWCVIGIATAVLVVGLVILAASAVWFVYRVVRGWTELNEGRPMYA